MGVKTLLFAIAIFFGILSSQAQTVVFSEDFETLPLEMTSSGLTNWARSTALSAGGSYSDTAIVGLSGTSYLTTNSFNTTGNYQVILEFDQICKIELFDGARIEYSVDGGTNWYQLTTAEYTGSGSFLGNKFNANSYVTTWQATTQTAIPTNAWWKHETFNISALVGNQANVMLRFALTDDNGTGPNQNYGWLIDNVEVTMSIDETIPPVISLINPYPADTAYNLGPFLVKADISDASGIDTSILVYTVNSGTPDTLTMINTSGTEFQASIPAQILNDTIRYYIYATDSATTHNSAREPVAGTIQFILRPSPPPPGCSSPVTVFPLVEDMESFTTGVPGTMANGWSGDPTSGFSWQVDKGGTPTYTTTGPLVDHTLGNSNGIYLFTESSSGSASDTAYVYSPCIDINALSNPTLSFYYHMYGSTMGELHVDIWYGNDWVLDIVPAFIGQQQTTQTDPYLNIIADLSPYKSITQIRFRAVKGSSTSGDMAIDDIKIYNLEQYDAGVIAMTEPVTPAPTGVQDVKVKFMNFGYDVLTSANINWSVNGVAQTPFNWAGSIFSLDTSAEITVGTYNFTTGFYTMKFWTSVPNGFADQYTNNDTLETTLVVCGSGLAGTYTIDAATGDFPTFSDAVSMLNTCGISAPVVFDVSPDTYNEQISIAPFTGSSAINTVTFTSSTGNSADVIMDYAPAGNTDNYTFQVLGGDYITVKNMTFMSSGTAYSRVLDVEDNSTNFTADSMILVGNAISGSSTYNAVIYTYDTDTNFTVSNSTILNGTYSMYLYASSSDYAQGLEVLNNTISNFSYYGIYTSYHDGGLIDGNTVEGAGSSAYSTLYGIRAGYFDNGVISNNKIIANGPSTNYGLYLYYCDASSGNEGIVANNMIIAGEPANTTTVYGIYQSTNTYQNLYYNSVNVLNDATTSRSFYLTGGSNISLYNNVFSNIGGGFAYYISTTAAEIASDYNDIYTSGATLAYFSGNRIDLSALQTASSHNTNSVSADPSFLSISDLHSSSLILDGAANPIAGFTTDIDGEVRDALTPDIGADEYELLNNDIAITSLEAPVSACNGSIENVDIRFANVGLQPVSSAKINWAVNGTPQPPFYFGGTLSISSDTVITIGTYTFMDGTTYTLEFIADSVNGVDDQFAGNDTLLYTPFQTSLSGIKTIGATGDYLTINDAVNDLVLKGVCSPVVFNIETGVYNEQVSIPEIAGASSANTITFQSTTGNASDVTYTYASTGTADNYIVRFNGTDYVTVQNMTLTNTGSSYSRAIDISGGADYNTVNNCILNVTSPTTPTTSSNYTVVYNTSGLDHGNTLSNSTLNGGVYSMYWYGSGSTSLENESVIENNIINDFQYYGIYMYYQNAPIIRGNTITQLNSANTYSTIYALNPRYCDSAMVIEANQINIQGSSAVYGLYPYYCDATSGQYGLISNNMVSVNSDNVTASIYAYYPYYCNYQKHYNNSVNVLSSSTNARGIYLSGGANSDFVNNIVVNAGGGYAVYISTTAAYGNSDFNDYYSTGSNIGYFSSAIPDLASWQAATGKDINSISVDPGYFSTLDLHSLSPSIDNLGTPLSEVTVDIDGDLRDALNPDMGADEFTPVSNDMTIVEFTNPIATCSGSADVDIRIFNSGLLDMTSGKVNWTVDGVPQTPFYFGGTLSPGSDTVVTIGTVTLVASTPVVLQAIADSVNGVNDQMAINDTASLTAYAAMAGVYTIGSSGDFLTINDAVDTLELYGVCSPVTFNIIPGTYNEQVELYPIAGASEINTITFQSASGDSTDVIIQYTATSTTDNYVVKLSGSGYFIFHQLTLSANGTSYARVFDLNASPGNTISNCVINSYSGSTSSSYHAGIYTNSSGTSNNTIENNVLNYGAYGIRFYGASAAYDYNNIIRNNALYGQTYYPMYLYYQDSLLVHGNIIEYDSLNMYTYNYGLRGSYIGTNCQITSNNVRIGASTSAYGIYFSTINAPSNSPLLIANNFISIGDATSAAYALYISGGNNVDVFNNSFEHNINSTTPRMIYSTASGVKVLNNILYSNTSVQGFYFTNAPDLCDYNNIYTLGSVGYVNSTTYSTFADWTTNSGYDLNAISVDPLYTGYMDFHVGNIALNGTAISLSSVPYDIDGETRPVATDIGADEFIPVGLDAAITWLAPVPPVSPGSLPVEVIITNVRTTTIDSVNLTYSDGITPITESFTGLSLLPNESDTLTFATNFNYLSVGQLYAYINSVNGISDDEQNNDTTNEVRLCQAMAGTYTIDPGQASSSSNFISIQNAIDALNCGGISATTTFEIATGTYSGHYIIPTITGTSPGNRVIFTSATGNNADVIISDSSQSASDNYIFQLYGASYISFEDLTFENRGSNYANVFDISGESDSIIIRNNILIGNTTTTSSINFAVVYSAGDLNNNTVIEGNTIQNGSYGIYMRGVGTSDKERGVQINGNNIEGFSYEGIYTYYQNNLTIIGNTVVSASEANAYTTMYGIYNYYTDSLIEISNNIVRLTPASTCYGMYFGSISNSALQSAMVYNNMVSMTSSVSSSTSFYGTYFTSTNNLDYIYNSILIENTSTGSDAVYVSSGTNIKLYNNNIINSGLGTAIYASSTSTITESDFNNIFSNGTVLGYYGGNMANLSEWITASSLDSNSVSLMPNLVSNSDLHINGISLMALGTPIAGISTDIDGDSRDALTPDIGADEFIPLLIDAGITQFDEPAASVSPGVQNVSVSIFNFGSTDLVSADIAWTVDGTPQSSYAWSGSLPFTNSEDSVLLGTANLSAGFHYLKAWTESPNGSTDLNNNNDTTEFSVTVCDGGVKGNYTIGLTGDFLSINDAIIYMKTCGIDSVTVFNIESGIYDEIVDLPYINGMADTSNVTFRAQSGNPADVILKPSVVGTDLAVIRFDSARYVNWQTTTIDIDSLTSARGFVIINEAKNIVIDSNIVLLPDVSTSTSNLCGIYDATGVDSNIVISNNSIYNGSYGMYLYGNSTTYQPGLVVSNNQVIGFASYGIYSYYLNNPSFTDNYIFTDTNTYSTIYGLRIYNTTDGVTVTGNNIAMGDNESGYGLYMYGNDGLAVSRGLVANNFISFEGQGPSNTSYAVYMSSCDYLDFVFNSIHLYDSYTSSRGVYVTGGTNITFQNNNVACTQGAIAVYFSSTTAVTTSNYNNIYSSGSVLGYYSGNIANLAAWQTATSDDANSYSMNPLFVSDTDLHIFLGSLDGKATPIAGISTDIDGDPRNATTPDIGADEFDGMPNDLAMNYISMPTMDYGFTSNSDTVKVHFTNYGANDASGFTISYSVNGMLQATQTYVGTLASGTIDSLQFATYFTPNAGPNEICAWLSLTGDGNNSNDTACTMYKGIPTLYAEYSDDFETNDYFGAQSETNSWEFGTPAGTVINSAYSPSTAWVTNLDGAYDFNMNDALYSPKFNFMGIYNAELRFYHQYDIEAGDIAYIEYSNNNGISWNSLGILNDPNGTNWYASTVGSYIGWNGTSSGWEYSTIDLSAFNNTPFPVQFRFVFYSDFSGTNGEGWAIDNFEIFVPTPDYDCGVTSILAPSGTLIPGSPETITLRIQNFGLNTLTSIPVVVTVTTGQPPITATWSGSLLPGDSVDYTLPSSYTPLTISNFDMCAYTDLATDLIDFNDTTCINLSTNVGIDEANALHNIQLNPNPAKDYTVLEFSTVINGNALISIRTPEGKLVQAKEVYISSGKNAFEIETHSLAAGVYIWRIDNEKISEEGKLIIVR